MYIVLGIIIILLIVTIHEFGHFIMGKLFKVPIYEFSIGMGPITWSKKGKSETVYSIRALPIGGFCSFDKGDITGIQDLSLNKQPIWKRIVIFAGGAIFNIISAIIISIGLCLFVGTPQTTTTIESIVSNYADEFLQPGDTITYINGIEVKNDLTKLQEIISNSNGTADITVLRDGEELTSAISLIKNQNSYSIGASISNVYVKSKGISAIKDGFVYAYNIGINVFVSLLSLITGKVSISEMSGIVGAVTVVGNAASQNIVSIFSYFILLSINIGIFNLLPIPVLDGSKILFCIFEAIFKKRIAEKVEEALTLLFAFLLLGLIIFLTISDIIKLF